MIGTEKKTAPPHKALWAIAVILALIALIALIVPRLRPDEDDSTGEGNYFELNGRIYCGSGRIGDLTFEIPEGFSFAGYISPFGQEEAYYTNPEKPHLIYIARTVTSNGELDATGTAIRTDPHPGYVLYVEDGLYLRDLISYNGQLYVSMLSAVDYTDDPDVRREFYARISETYGVNVATLPEGFASVGTADFSGFYTIPTGSLSFNGRIASNEAPFEVFASDTTDEVIFAAVVSTVLRPSYTDTYDTFIRCDKVIS